MTTNRGVRTRRQAKHNTVKSGLRNIIPTKTGHLSRQARDIRKWKPKQRWCFRCFAGWVTAAGEHKPIWSALLNLFPKLPIGSRIVHSSQTPQVGCGMGADGHTDCPEGLYTSLFAFPSVPAPANISV